ncbi:MAG TPA: SRPBCC domain-containing protein [Candidatus Limnocylindria bacterium]|nr:SRPBCC domain-containing protein [Candidatus Limnocylindria bacterium]
MTVDTKAIEKVISIQAKPETVFRLLTEPREYVRWKGKLAELEPRPGGKFRVDFLNDKDVAVGNYVEVVPARRVVFTWGWEGNEIVPPGSSTVEIDLEPEGEGTRLRLVHRGLPEPAIPTHTEGWDFFLPRLTNIAEGREADAGAGQHTAQKM